MKLNFLFFIILSLSPAQEHFFGLSLVSNYSSFSPKEDNTPQGQLNFSTGFIYADRLSYDISYFIQFLYDKRDFSFKEDGFDKSLKLTYLSVSPQLSYYLNRDFFLSAGLSLKQNIGAKKKFSLGEFDLVGDEDAKKYLYAGIISAHYVFRLRPISLIASLQYERSFDDALKNSDFSSQMNSIIFSLSISFR